MSVWPTCCSRPEPAGVAGYGACLCLYSLAGVEDLERRSPRRRPPRSRCRSRWRASDLDYKRGQAAVIRNVRILPPTFRPSGGSNGRSARTSTTSYGGAKAPPRQFRLFQCASAERARPASWGYGELNGRLSWRTHPRATISRHVDWPSQGIRSGQEQRDHQSPTIASITREPAPATPRSAGPRGGRRKRTAGFVAAVIAPAGASIRRIRNAKAGLVPGLSCRRATGAVMLRACGPISRDDPSREPRLSEGRARARSRM